MKSSEKGFGFLCKPDCPGTEKRAGRGLNVMSDVQNAFMGCLFEIKIMTYWEHIVNKLNLILLEASF